MDTNMRTLVVHLDDDLFSKAERKATTLQTSVRDVVADYLRAWIGEAQNFDDGRQAMGERFAKKNWTFAVGKLESREERNARHSQTVFEIATVGQRYFDDIKEIWRPFAPRRVIPFCTPVLDRPQALVIGKNHSDFVRGGGSHADAIADLFASTIPTFSTFLEHSHVFAEGLWAVCRRAEIAIDERWMGTNRCAVQTGPEGIDEIRKCREFRDCQSRMDDILQQLVDEIAPVNLILAGQFATELYYPRGKRIAEMNSTDRSTSNGRSVRIIPIPHWSRATFWADAAHRLQRDFLRK